MALSRELWSEPVAADEAHRRAGGRRAYNHWRQHMAQYRRYRLVSIAARSGLNLWTRGSQAVLARALGVSPATISRDMRAILDEIRPGRPCPVCRCAVRHIGWIGSPWAQLAYGKDDDLWPGDAARSPVPSGMV